MASSPDAGAFLGDEALDGSGSGDSPVWRQHGKGEIDDDEDDHDDNRDDDEASGSGMGPITSGTVSCTSVSHYYVRVDLHFDNSTDPYSWWNSIAGCRILYRCLGKGASLPGEFRSIE